MNKKEIEALKKKANRSCIYRFDNGYEAHYIDLHPHCDIYRNPHNGLGYCAFKDEEIMLINSSGCVVLFLKNKGELHETINKMHLKIAE